MQRRHFKITVYGCATHGATPHLGADAIVAGSKIIELLQTIVSRSSNPLDEISVTIGSVHSGTQFNIVSDTAVLEGTYSVSAEELCCWIQEEILRISEFAAKSLKCMAEVEFASGSAGEVEA